MTTKTSTRFGNFRLKGLKTLRGQENEAFEAELTHGGVTVAYVSNTGTGGSHMWTWVNPASERTFRDLAIIADDGTAFEMEDSLVWDLIEATKLARKKGLVFTMPEDGDFWTEGQYRTAPASAVLPDAMLKAAKFFDRDSLEFV